MQKDGFISNETKSRSYLGSQTTGMIFLGTDEDCAGSYAESADNISEAMFESGIVVLEIDTTNLDNTLFSADPNILSDCLAATESFAYKGKIPLEYTKVITENY